VSRCLDGATVTRTVLIHAGTHKTGTTSLQGLFTRHRADLLDRGILYPHTGVMPNDYESDSHTNLAWQLMGHNSFNPAWGTLDDVVEEIKTSDCPKVLLSSENFSLLFKQPDRLHQLRESFQEIDFSPHISLVFREVSEFTDSLYITLVNDGLTLTHAEYSKTVAENGQVVKDGTTFCFDKEVIARSFMEVFGKDSVTCLDYDPVDAVRPFLEAFDWFFEGGLDGADHSVRSNTTMTRVEALGDSLRAERARIADLEAQIERLNLEVDRLTQRLSHRLEGRIRTTLARRRHG
jgi:hypothetical protein